MMGKQKHIVLVAWRGGVAWIVREDAEMGYWITHGGMWIFASLCVIVFAGLLWAALSADLQSLIGVFQNLF